MNDRDVVRGLVADDERLLELYRRDARFKTSLEACVRLLPHVVEGLAREAEDRRDAALRQLEAPVRAERGEEFRPLDDLLRRNSRQIRDALDGVLEGPPPQCPSSAPAPKSYLRCTKPAGHRSNHGSEGLENVYWAEP